MAPATPQRRGVTSAEAASWLPPIRLEITDAAFRSQSLSLSWSNCQGLDSVCDSGPTGDFSKIVSICNFCSIGPDSSRLFGWGNVELTWNESGALNGEIFLEGDIDDLTLDIVGQRSQRLLRRRCEPVRHGAGPAMRRAGRHGVPRPVRLPRARARVICAAGGRITRCRNRAEADIGYVVARAAKPARLVVP